jgi:hypothetical protein
MSLPSWASGESPAVSPPEQARVKQASRKLASAATIEALGDGRFFMAAVL